METIERKTQRRRREGDPAGTYFAITVMIALFALVGVYLISAYAKDISFSPVLQEKPGAKTVTPTSGFY